MAGKPRRPGSSRSSSTTVAILELPSGVQVRASIGSWGQRVLAHLRTWFRGKDGRWWPTRRGITVPPEQLLELEEAVRALREAYEAGGSQGSAEAGHAEEDDKA